MSDAIEIDQVRYFKSGFGAHVKIIDGPFVDSAHDGQTTWLVQGGMTGDWFRMTADAIEGETTL